MNMKSIILKEVEPVLSAKGYYCRNMAPRDYTFSDINNTRTISFCLAPHMPKQLIVRYFVRGKSRFSLELNQFSSEYNGFYNSQAELMLLVKQAIKVTTQIVLPYINIMEEVYFEPSEDLYKDLSYNTRKRAEIFSLKYHLPICLQKTNFYEIDKIIKELRPKDLILQRAVFMANKEILLNIAAYLGEILLLADPKCHWGWRQLKDVSFRVMHIINDYQQYGLILSSKDTALAVDPLGRLVLAWNFAELNGYEISKFPLKNSGHGMIEKHRDLVQ